MTTCRLLFALGTLFALCALVLAAYIAREAGA